MVIQPPPSPNHRREEQPPVGVVGGSAGGDGGGDGRGEYVIFPDNADAEAAAIAAGNKAKDNKMADQTFREALEELLAKFENKELKHEIECPAWLDLPSFTGLLVKYRLRKKKKKTNETKKIKKQRTLTNKHILGYCCLFSILVVGIIILYYRHHQSMSSYDSIDQTITNASPSYVDALSILSLLFNTTYSISLFGNSRNSHHQEQSATASPITINVILIHNDNSNQQKNDEQHYYDHYGIEDEEGYYGDFEL